MGRPRLLDPFRQARACACGEHGFVGLTRGFVTLVDAEDVPLVAGRTWQAARRGAIIYATHVHKICGENLTLLMHRHLVGGDSPHTDHRDGDGLNNRRGNLRGCTHAQNMRNRRHQRSSAVPFKGVHRNRSRFGAHIRFEGRLLWLGTFDTPEAAARAYDDASLRLHGEWGRTNVALGLLPVAAE